MLKGEAGETVIPRGKPLTVTLAEPAKPFSGIRERVTAGVVPPTSAEVDDGETDMLKSGIGIVEATPPPPAQPVNINVIVSRERSRVRLSNSGRGGWQSPLVRNNIRL
jgi:hypothetical protein